jgi:class 3 adenylate cyclase
MPPPEPSLVCPSCQANNRSGRKFCSRCGGRLSAACPACGFVNEPDEDFCGGCGVRVATAADSASVGTTTPPPPVATAPPPPVRAREEAERRQLTVMFCDLVGSTELSTRLDAEDLRDLIRAYQERTASHVEAFDGFIARYMGDGILVYFGYPRAHEDDAERAVRAALAILDACSSLGASVRIGVATGVAIVGDVIGEGASEERAVVGDAPNLAARLQTLAEPGSIVVSDTTRTLLPNSFDLEPLGERSLKGFAEPVPVFRARGVRHAASRFESRRDVGLSPLVGRERELSGGMRREQHGEVRRRNGSGGAGIHGAAQHVEEPAHALGRAFDLERGLVVLGRRHDRARQARRPKHPHGRRQRARIDPRDRRGHAHEQRLVAGEARERVLVERERLPCRLGVVGRDPQLAAHPGDHEPAEHEQRLRDAVRRLRGNLEVRQKADLRSAELCPRAVVRRERKLEQLRIGLGDVEQRLGLRAPADRQRPARIRQPRRLREVRQRKHESDQRSEQQRIHGTAPGVRAGRGVRACSPPSDRV